MPLCTDPWPNTADLERERERERMGGERERGVWGGGGGGGRGGRERGIVHITFPYRFESKGKPTARGQGHQSSTKGQPQRM